MASKQSSRKPHKSPDSTLVEIHGKHILTTSLIVAEGCELEHKQAIANIRKFQADFEELGPCAFETRKGEALPQGGFAKSTEYAILNEDQATYLITLFRNTPIVRRFKLNLVKAFRAAINELQRIRQQQFNLDWQQQRLESRIEFRLMNETLKIARAEQGKETTAHHYTNEARLINGVLTGLHAPVDRATLTTQELALLAKLELKNTVLIGRGIAYTDRKTLLQQYAIDLRTPIQPALPRYTPQQALIA